MNFEFTSREKNFYFINLYKYSFISERNNIYEHEHIERTWEISILTRKRNWRINVDRSSRCTAR